MEYSAKVVKILNYTIQSIDTWEKIPGTPIAGVRKWFIKTANDTDNAFDLAFESSPSTYLTSDGSGFTFDQCDLPDIYVRTSFAGTKFEICYWG